MKLPYLLLVVSVLSSGYGQETGTLPPSTNSRVGDESPSGDSSSPGETKGDATMKKVTFEACRRDPTWRGNAVDHDECRLLTGWKPRDFWWHVDKNHTEEHLEGQEKAIADCIDMHFRRAKEDRLWWALCDENDVDDENCNVPPMKVIGHYKRNDKDVDADENGDLVIIKNTLTEQEAYGLEALQKCMHVLLEDEDDTFFEERTFGDEEDAGLYKGAGGNVVTFMTGMLQLYLPGVACSAHRALSAAHKFAGWDVPAPESMGMRNSEFLKYHRVGRLGVHDDEGSIMTISMALSNPEDFAGGYFHLYEEDALFKVPRLTGIVFLANTSHGITEIGGGTRKVFVAELWDDDDTPVTGGARPDHEDFKEHKDERMKVLQMSGKKVVDAEEEGMKAEAMADVHSEL